MEYIIKRNKKLKEQNDQFQKIKHLIQNIRDELKEQYSKEESSYQMELKMVKSKLNASKLENIELKSKLEKESGIKQNHQKSQAHCKKRLNISKQLNDCKNPRRINRETIEEFKVKSEHLVDEKLTYEEETEKLRKEIAQLNEKITEYKEIVKEISLINDFKERFLKLEEIIKELRKEKKIVDSHNGKAMDEDSKFSNDYSYLEDKYSDILERNSEVQNKLSELEEGSQSLEFSNIPLEEYKEVVCNNNTLKKNESCKNDEEEKDDNMLYDIKREKTSKKIKRNMKSLAEPKEVEYNINEYKIKNSSDGSRNIPDEKSVYEKIRGKNQSLNVGVSKLPKGPKSTKGPKPKKVRKAKKHKDESFK